jgi:hypothetical protein
MKKRENFDKCKAVMFEDLRFSVDPSVQDLIIRNQRCSGYTAVLKKIGLGHYEYFGTFSYNEILAMDLDAENLILVK